MTELSPKKRILSAGEEIMAETGLNSKISHIATRAGVSDSVLYHYFKNKEDLLFSIAEERLRDLRETMEEQMLGLNDPLSRLRKLFFFRLHYLEKNRNYGNLLMFECRSNMSFYSHPAFAQARWFMALLGQILRDGIKADIFRKDLNIWLVRDALFGLLDLANIHMLLGKDNDITFSYEDLFELIEPMIIKQTGQPASTQDKRQRILRAAETFFAEKGYENATIQEIATAAGVGDGTVYDYFKNKEDVLFNTLKDGFQPSAHRKGFQEHLIAPAGHQEQLTPLSKLEHFLRRQFQIALIQPSFAKIFIINGIYNKKFYDSDAFQDFDRYMETLSRIINDGKQEKTFRETITPEAFRLLVLGSFSHLTLRWLISDKKTNIDKAGEINAMTELVIRSISVA